MPVSRADHDRARDLFLESMSKETDSRIDEVVADDYVASIAFPTQEPGREGLKKIFADARRAFPDAVWTQEFQIIEGNKQALRYHARGSHQGDWLGIKAKGNKVDLPAIFVLELNDKGQVKSSEMFMDGMVLMSQMNA